MKRVPYSWRKARKKLKNNCCKSKLCIVTCIQLGKYYEGDLMANLLRKKGKSGTRKYGRNKIKCAKYELQGRREINKKKKMAKHAKKVARQALWRARYEPKPKTEVVIEIREEGFIIGGNAQERWFRPDKESAHPKDYNLPYVKYIEIKKEQPHAKKSTQKAAQDNAAGHGDAKERLQHPLQV